MQSKIQATMANNKLKMGDSIEKSASHNLMMYISSQINIHIFISEWTSLWENPTDLLFLVEDSSRLSLVKNLLAQETITYAQFNNLAVLPKSVIFYDVQDFKYLKSFLNENQSTLNKVACCTAITSSPHVFISYYSSPLPKYLKCFIPPNSTRSFFRQLFKTTEIIYYAEFEEHPEYLSWLERFRVIPSPSGATANSFSKILSVDLIALPLILAESNLYDSSALGYSNEHSLRSQKLSCLYSFIKEKESEKIIIYVSSPTNLKILYEIIRSWSWCEREISHPDISTNAIINDRFLINSNIKLNILLINRLPLDDRYAKSTNLLLFDFIQAIFKCHVFIFSSHKLGRLFKEMIFADDKIEIEIRNKLNTNNEQNEEGLSINQTQGHPSTKQCSLDTAHTDLVDDRTADSDKTNNSGGTNNSGTICNPMVFANTIKPKTDVERRDKDPKISSAYLSDIEKICDPINSNKKKEKGKYLSQISTIKNNTIFAVDNLDGPDHNCYRYKILSDDYERIQILTQNKKHIRRVSKGMQSTFLTARCTVGKIQTAINIQNFLDIPVVMPSVVFNTPRPFFSAECCKIAIGTITSFKRFAQTAFFSQGFVTINSRGFSIYAFYAKINLKIELSRETIENYILMYVKNSNKNSASTPELTCDLLLPLKHHANLSLHDKNILLHKKIKENCSIHEKIAFFESLEWKRASADQLPEFKDNVDLQISIPLNITNLDLNTAIDEKPQMCDENHSNLIKTINQNAGDDSAHANNKEGMKNTYKASLTHPETLADNPSLPSCVKAPLTYPELLADNTSLLSCIIHILTNYACTLVYTTFHLESINYTFSDFLDYFSDQDFPAIYSLASIISRKGRLFVNKFVEKDMPRIKRAGLQSFCQALDINLKYRFGKFNIEKVFTDAKNIKIKENSMRTATVTPFSIVLGRDNSSGTNRVLRYFDPDKFLRFSIRDSNMSSFRNDLTVDQDYVYEYFRRIMLEGLVIGSRKYFFLAATTSQLKEHNAWFVTPFTRDGVVIGTNYIKSWLGDFSGIKNIGKYVVRVGQALSTTTATLEPKNFIEVSDIERNGYCFTDGIGIISQALANALAKTLNLVNVPTAFQIRFAGYKGVVAVHPLLENKKIFGEWANRNGYKKNRDESEITLCDEGAELEISKPAKPLEDEYENLPDFVLRNSMNKFPSKHRSIEVVATSKSYEFYLNRQIILILEGLKIPSQTFKNLQDRYVLSVLKDIDLDLPGFVKKYVPFFPSNFISTDFRFFRKLLQPLLTRVFEDLNKKSKIHVPEGRAAIGVIDELEILEADEVFLMFDSSICMHEGTTNSAYTRQYGVYTVPVGPAIVAKNPCLHPGDIRVVRCVDRKELHYLKDVIVFSQKGERPLFNQCSGSDLDGDIFLVSWNPFLIPKVLFKPYNYVSTSALVKETVLLSDMVNFYIKYIKSYQLGLIANSFMSESDQSTVFGPRSLRLAELFNRNIDFIKTGNIASLPEDLITEVFPDFMERLPSYKSERVTGELYRRSNIGKIHAGCECSFCILECMNKMEKWEIFILEGSNPLIREERVQDGIGKNDVACDGLFISYVSEIRELISRHGTGNEESLFCSKEPAVLAELKELISKYSTEIKGAEIAKLADMSSRCKENINSLAWLSPDAYKIKIDRLLYKSSGTSNFGFNANIILVEKGDKKENGLNMEMVQGGNNMKAPLDQKANDKPGNSPNTKGEAQQNHSEHDGTIHKNCRAQELLFETNSRVEVNNLMSIEDEIERLCNKTKGWSEPRFNVKKNKYNGISEDKTTEDPKIAQSCNNQYSDTMISIEGDVSKYTGFYVSLDVKRKNVFKELFNLLLIAGVYKIDQIDQIINMMIKVNERMKDSSTLELVRVLFAMSDDVLFRIGILICLDCSIVYKALMLRELKCEYNILNRPPKIFKSYYLILGGMLDENEDVEFITTHSDLMEKPVYLPVLKNKGTCSLDYYKDSVREFLINILYSKKCLQYIKSTINMECLSVLPNNQDFFADSNFDGSCVEFIIKFTPGIFFLNRLSPLLIHDKMSVRELESRIARNDPNISTWFANKHKCLESSERAAFLKQIKTLEKNKEVTMLKFMFNNVRYDLIYVDSVLLKVLKGRQILGKGYIINAQANENVNDIAMELIRYEIIYGDNINRISSAEAFMLKPGLYSFDNKQCILSQTLSNCSSYRLETNTSFSNECSFFLTHRTVYSGNGLVMNQTDMKLYCYAEKKWSPGESFDKIFGRLWKVYLNVLA